MSIPIEIVIVLLCASHVATALIARQLAIDECYHAFLRGMSRELQKYTREEHGHKDSPPM
jgi:hypothetical protein